MEITVRAGLAHSHLIDGLRAMISDRAMAVTCNVGDSAAADVSHAPDQVSAGEPGALRVPLMHPRNALHCLLVCKQLSCRGCREAQGRRQS